MTKDQFRREIGQNIRNERTLRCISIEELASMLRLTPGYVGLIEHGARGATTYNLYRLSEIFEIDINMLYPQSEKMQMDLVEHMPTNAKHRKLLKLCYGLNNNELDFLIYTVKLLYKLRFPTEMHLFDDDEDYDFDLEYEYENISKMI